jgi:hypothetical protein
MKAFTRKILRVLGFLLALIAFLQLTRFFFPIPILTGCLCTPLWISGVIYIVGGCLSGYLFRLSRNLSHPKFKPKPLYQPEPENLQNPPQTHVPLQKN